MSNNPYREFARECMQWAEEAASEADREHFLEMARAWINAAGRLGEASHHNPSTNQRPTRKKRSNGMRPPPQKESGDSA